MEEQSRELFRLLMAGELGGGGVAQRASNRATPKTILNTMPTRQIDLNFIKDKQLDEAYSRCIVCLMDYEDQEEVRTLPCMHYFHK